MHDVVSADHPLYWLPTGRRLLTRDLLLPHLLPLHSLGLTQLDIGPALRKISCSHQAGVLSAHVVELCFSFHYSAPIA